MRASNRCIWSIGCSKKVDFPPQSKKRPLLRGVFVFASIKSDRLNDYALGFSVATFVAGSQLI